MKWAIIINATITERDLKNISEREDHELQLLVRHPNSFLKEDGEPITYENPQKAWEKAIELKKGLPPFKYTVSLVQVVGA